MKFLLKALTAGMLSLMLWEVISRVAFYSSPATHDDPILGRILSKGIRISGEEGYSITKFNSLGMRNVELHQKNGNMRYLVLGDSYTEGLQVSDKQLFSSLLDNKSKTIDVINAGRSGASPATYIQLASYYKKEIDPDFTIIQLNQDDFYGDAFNKNSDFYVEKYQGQYRALKNEHLSRSNIIAEKIPQLNFISEISVVRKAFINLQNLIQSSPPKDKIQTFDHEAASWMLEQMKQSYTNVVVLYIPTIDYYHYENDNSLEDYLETKSSEIGLDFINMRLPFIESFQKTQQPAHGFNNTVPGTGHINKIGHKLIADELNKYFKQVSR
ncbi:SGNH/GDSL hydrolase family protein [Cohnella faecalis]|uniref:SGNH/GDSL hydrolase family protein n=1 Tax=Cohnella faecalis TaxID=2315694 RepID=A0A398CHG5_9BACL|nr:SGNH/GDSL hydrolase family protein [Cohnella faecalis]RIE02656.1 SGNH/GDSL hydrolase family protein [Cohnella faecalis]